jgi:CRISPR system Cascade subunit CasA
MPSFDLTYEPWIPVLDAGTNLRVHPNAPVTSREVGLRELLTRAHEIREVYCDSPLETVAIYRLVLALFIDGFSCSPDEEIWMQTWHQGYLTSEDVAAYFDRPEHQGRFDLLHPERPFYQHPLPLAKEVAPLSKLFHAEASGNNGTLFDHSMDDVPRTLSMPTIARGLVATQASAIGGGVSEPFNLSHGPLVGGAVFWIRGHSLFEALLLNAPPDDKARMQAFANVGQPAWRRPLPALHERRASEGYLDYLTWQSRRITLVTTETAPLVATGVYLTQGDRNDPVTDPLMARVIPQDTKKPPFPFNFRAEKALWRDANLLLQLQATDKGFGPRTFWWLRDFAPTWYQNEADWRGRCELVDVFGLVNDQAKIELWRQERLPVYLGYLSEPDRVQQLGVYLKDAEDQAFLLKEAMKHLATYLLDAPAAGEDDPPKPDPKAVNNLVQALGAETRYWTALEPGFHRFLARLATLPLEQIRTVRWEWTEHIFQTARTAFRETTATLDQQARQLRAVAEGERRLMHVKAHREHIKELKEVSA